MSKAFTSEENDDAGIAGRLVERAAPGEERPITPDGHRTLVERRETLLTERAAVAAEHAPDRDVRLRELDHRLALAAAALDSVRVVAPVAADGVVRFGSWVTLEWDDGRRQRVQLVGPDEAGGAERLSVVSPIARAVLGLRVGDAAEVELPRGVLEVTIREVA